MIALAAMSAGWQAVFYIIAFVVFAAASLNAVTRVNLVAVGLAAFVVPFAWNALAAA